jgi:hypothetical protein
MRSSVSIWLHSLADASENQLLLRIWTRLESSEGYVYIAIIQYKYEPFVPPEREIMPH